MKINDQEKPGTGSAADMIVRDATGRRRFVKTGTALLLASGAVLASRASLAADCDHGNGGRPGSKGSKQAVSGSDSDAGAQADPPGCGRQRNDPPALSRADSPDGSSGKVAPVAKIVSS